MVVSRVSENQTWLNLKAAKFFFNSPSRSRILGFLKLFWLSQPWLFLFGSSRKGLRENDSVEHFELRIEEQGSVGLIVLGGYFGM